MPRRMWGTPLLLVGLAMVHGKGWARFAHAGIMTELCETAAVLMTWHQASAIVPQAFQPMESGHRRLQAVPPPSFCFALHMVYV